MPKKLAEGLQQEAVKLRVESRYSIRHVCKILGVSRGTVSAWLKPYPLTPEECRERLIASIGRVQGEESRLHQLLGGRELPRAAKARISEAAILLRLVAQGWEVYGSPFDGDKFDWVVNLGPRLVRLQVKSTSSQADESPQVRLRCSDGKASRRYREGEFDFIVGYDFFTDTAYVWSWPEVEGRACISVTHESAERWDKLLG